MTRTLRRGLAALTALTLAATAAACGSDDDATPSSAATDERTPVTLMLDWTPNTNHSGFYLAQQRGYYEEAGLDVEIIEPGNDGALPQLATGNVQFAISVAEQLLPARAEGVEAVSIAAIIAHNTSSLVVPTDRGVTRPRDLAGKTYGGFGGELEKQLVEKLVTCDGGDPSGIRYVEIGNVDYKIGLEKKDYDAVWVFDGWDVIRLRDLEGMDLTTLPFYEPGKSCMPDWYTPLLATSQQLIDDDPELVKAFTAATAKGFEDARTDAKAAAAALLQGAPELDKELVERSAAYLADRYADKGQPWGVQDQKVWTTFAAFLSGGGLLAADVDATKAFTNTFLPAG